VDEIDRAERDIEQHLSASLSHAHKPLYPPANGCLNCGAALEQPLRFCDADCKQDLEKRYALSRINGNKKGAVYGR
jgi:hypothetical protein